MSNSQINSLRDLRKRKARINRELNIIEEEMQDGFHKITHPLSWFRSAVNDEDTESGSTFFSSFKSNTTMQTVLSVASTAVTVFSLIKKCRGK